MYNECTCIFCTVYFWDNWSIISICIRVWQFLCICFLMQYETTDISTVIIHFWCACCFDKNYPVGTWVENCICFIYMWNTRRVIRIDDVCICSNDCFISNGRVNATSLKSPSIYICSYTLTRSKQMIFYQGLRRKQNNGSNNMMLSCSRENINISFEMLLWTSMVSM